MKIKEVFDIGEIMEMEDKSKKIKVLDSTDCKIVGKALNKNKIILNMKRESDESEGNVFVRLNDKHADQFAISKKLLACKKVLGLNLKEFAEFSIEEL